jgi:hypothetical protein
MIRGGRMSRFTRKLSLEPFEKLAAPEEPDNWSARAAHIHTSGHASPDHLREFAQSIEAKLLVPIHGIAWDGDIEGFSHIRRLNDGEPLLM